MNQLKTALLKLKTEASERRETALYRFTAGGTAYEEDHFRGGFDSRQAEIDVLISIIELQSKALEVASPYVSLTTHAPLYGSSLLYANKAKIESAQSDVLALLSGLEGKE